MALRLKEALQNTVLGFCVAIVFFSVAAGGYLQVRYASVMPRSPQPEAGRVIRVVVNHGTAVYINQKESDRLDFVDYYLAPASGLCVLLA